jgi:hypothetical protein
MGRQEFRELDAYAERTLAVYRDAEAFVDDRHNVKRFVDAWIVSPNNFAVAALLGLSPSVVEIVAELMNIAGVKLATTTHDRH